MSRVWCAWWLPTRPGSAPATGLLEGGKKIITAEGGADDIISPGLLRSSPAEGWARWPTFPSQLLIFSHPREPGTPTGSPGNTTGTSSAFKNTTSLPDANCANKVGVARVGKVTFYPVEGEERRIGYHRRGPSLTPAPPAWTLNYVYTHVNTHTHAGWRVMEQILGMS